MGKGTWLIWLFILMIWINSISCIRNNVNHLVTNVEIIDTTFVSKFVDDSIRIDISLPAGYNNNSEKIYPIVYMTDGYWRREIHGTIHQMSSNKEIHEVILVGIGYPDGYDFNNIRVRDLIINADKLLSCIKEEIIPYVEKRYRVNLQNRTLWGSSYGGYFLVYSFTEHVKQGRLFKNYICASAALNPPYPNVDLLNNEKKLWESTKELSVSLYITVGGLETPFFLDSYDKIINTIKSHNYQDFHFVYEIIPGTDHYTVWKPTLLKGLKKFLNK